MTRRTIATIALLAVYVAVTVKVIVSLGGVPASRETLIVLILGGIAAASLTSVRRLRRLAVGIVVDWLPFAFMLALYDLIRGHADGLWFPAHAMPQIRFDRFLGRGNVPTVWLQRRLWHGNRHLRWYDYGTWLTYMSYFFVPEIMLAILWWRSRSAFRLFASMVVALAFLGCGTYVLFPAVPPWIAAYRGLIPPIAHILPVVNPHVPVISFQPLWKKGHEYANNIAAIPSLHAGYTMLVALFIGLRARSRTRHLVWLYPPAMAFALVYSGEHYVTDVLIGWVYAIAVYSVASAIARPSSALRTAASAASSTWSASSPLARWGRPARNASTSSSIPRPRVSSSPRDS